MANYFEQSIVIHEQLRGTNALHHKMLVNRRDDLFLADAVGFARPCEVIASDSERVRELKIQRDLAAACRASAADFCGEVGR